VVVELLLLSFCIPVYEITSLSRVSVPPTTTMELLGNIVKRKSKFVSVIIHQINLLYWPVVHTHCVRNPPSFHIIHSFIHVLSSFVLSQTSCEVYLNLE
jgi:hypothetical protein